MSDLISRQAVMKEFSDFVRRSNNSDFAKTPTWNDAVSLVESTPSAQPEIIRCKDCKYCEHWYADKGRCFLWHEGGIDVFEEGFCNYAKRRTDGRPDKP